MGRKTIMILGVLVITASLGGLIYWYTLTIPSQEEINAAVKPIEKINRNILSDQTIEKLRDLNMNGDLPLAVDEGSLGNNNPF